MKRRLLQTLITVTVMSSLIVAPVSAAPQDDVKNLEEKKSEAQAQADSVNQELVDLLVDYDALQIDIKNQGERIDQAESDLKAAEKKEKQQYEDMKLRIKYMYEEGDMSAFLTLISAKSFSDFVSKAEYIQKVHEYDRGKLDEYVETKNEVSDLKDGLEEGQAEMQFMADEMKVQKSNLETTLTEMKKQVDDFDSQLTQAKEAAAEELQRIEAEQQAAEALETAGEEQTAQTEDDQSKGESSESEDDSQKEENEDSKEEQKPQSKPSNDSDKDKEEDKKPDKNPDKDDAKEEEDKKEESSTSSGNASLGQQIADKGCEYVGNKYVYGGNSLTNGIDCSGFVQQIHKKFGISTPRSSSAQRKGGKSVSYANKMPGDVICYSGHVAIYIGNNKIVHASNSAPYPKGGIKISSPANYRTVLAVRRYW